MGTWYNRKKGVSMSVYGDAILGGIAWEAFAQMYGFYNEKVTDFALRFYIAQQLKSMANAEVFTPKQLEEMTDVIEATVIETPEEIKQMDEPKEAFEAYFKENQNIKNVTNIVNGTLQGVQHNEGTVNMHFGDVLNSPK